MDIKATVNPSGDLEICADAEAREELAALGYRERESVVGDSLSGDYEFVRPEWIGALTDSPILADFLDWPDSGQPKVHPDGKLWWFPDYMVIDPWQALAADGKVTFLRADVDTAPAGR